MKNAILILQIGQNPFIFVLQKIRDEQLNYYAQHTFKRTYLFYPPGSDGSDKQE